MLKTAKCNQVLFDYHTVREIRHVLVSLQIFAFANEFLMQMSCISGFPLPATGLLAGRQALW